jgi:hypothetical protein
MDLPFANFPSIGQGMEQQFRTPVNGHLHIAQTDCGPIAPMAHLTIEGFE